MMAGQASSVTFVLGRRNDRLENSGPAARLGTYRALDGSDGAPLALDLDRPHAMLIVGKRGYGKSYTLAVVAEGLARSRGLAPVVLDPMGAFDTLSKGSAQPPVQAEIVRSPTVAPDSLSPRSWCSMLELSPAGGPGGLVWKAASECGTIEGMRAEIRASNSPLADERAACNHLDLADSWGVFDPRGLSADNLGGPEVTVIDLAGVDPGPMNAVARGVAETLYRGREADDIPRLPWLLVDEAHAFFEGIGGPALRRILTRGRAPGVSIALATQRPSAVPAVAVSQSDLLVSHRLTAQTDIAALQAAQPTYLDETLAERMPDRPGEILVIDDATETVHAASVRERDTPHGAASPRAGHRQIDTAESD
jgi:hypothetical protein